ncbi:hypothetical protein GCM10027578_32300 [Spirosoma luteolum]
MTSLPPTTGPRARLHTLLNAPAFRAEGNPSDWPALFAELILLTSDLLDEADRAGQRIDFYKGVGVRGKLQDITSLVSWFRTQLNPGGALALSPALLTRLNRYQNEGNGYFANGSFFASEFPGDVAFFLDDQRVYLDNQLRLAVEQAEARLALVR